jgi:3-hydroxyacyl-[acyl-carrier-protein] dehydratase
MRLEHFDMIDRVTRLDIPGRALTAEATVPAESPVFEGHFPGYPLLPGVLLTETMAQASGYLLLALNGFARMPFLMAVDKARFRAFVGPGEAIEIEARFELEGSGYAATRASVRRDGVTVADAALRFRLTDFPNELSALMTARADRIGLTALAGP